MTVHPDAVRAARLQIVAAGSVLSRHRLILPGEGNLSVKCDGTSLVVTPAGTDKARLEPGQLIVADFESQELPPRASSELRVHLEVYRQHPGVRAVVHAHPPRVQALDTMGREPRCSLLLEAQALLGAVGRVRALSPGSRELAVSVAEKIGDAPVCVMARHGALAVASSMDRAILRMLLLERLAGLTLAACGR